MEKQFLPINAEQCHSRGWDTPDFVYVCGDAYVDHPSFGAAIISRVLEAEGFRVAMLCQPNFKGCDDFKSFGRPRLGFLVSSGNIDSMVAHYTVAKRRRNYDYYSPGGKIGYRPDRAVIVYCNRIREAYGDIPIILGGIEASLRRFAHYDYWDDRVRNSILVDSGADILTYGMGEKIIPRIAKLLDKGVPIKKIHDVRGSVYLTSRDDKIHYESVGHFEIDQLKQDKKVYADAFRIQYINQDAITGKAIVEYYKDRMLVQNPPMPVLEREELDRVYALPYMRTYHPIYEKDGGIPAIKEVEFSITHNRGCFGSCNFCALAFHQGRTVRSRSIESVVKEAKLLTKAPNFKGYIHDIGGPTANFRNPACDKQIKHGVCPEKRCLAPTPCKNLKVDHSEYKELIERVEAIPGIKKVFIRSGIRFDYLIYDKDDSFFRKLIRDNVSGQLKVAPEHICNNVLTLLGKPSNEVYEKFKNKFFRLTAECGKEQYLIPYLMSSHPGSRLEDALELALFLKKQGYSPEQVQDFYPTPGTASTTMFYTGIDPFTGKEVFIPKSPQEKRLQRALLRYFDPQNADAVREALRLCNREDLIGFSPNCLVPPEKEEKGRHNRPYEGKKSDRSSLENKKRYSKEKESKRICRQNKGSGSKQTKHIKKTKK